MGRIKNINELEKFEEELISTVKKDSRFKFIGDFTGVETRILAVSIYEDMHRLMTNRTESNTMIEKVIKAIKKEVNKGIIEVVDVLIIQKESNPESDTLLEYDVCFKIVK